MSCTMFTRFKKKHHLHLKKFHHLRQFENSHIDSMTMTSSSFQEDRKLKLPHQPNPTTIISIHIDKRFQRQVGA